MKSVKIAGAILFTLGFCMATGVDVNPIQAVYALVLIGGALACFKTASRLEKVMNLSASFVTLLNKIKSLIASLA